MSSSVHIEAAGNAGDLAEIEALATVIWREHYTPIIGAEQVAYMLERFQSASAMRTQLDQGYRYFALRDGGRLEGYCAVLSEGDALLLSKLYVAKRARGRGHGRRMVGFVEGLAREGGLPRLRLNVNKHNDASIAAYAKLGFARVGARVADIGGGFVMDDWVLEKPL